jgi:hypothetical protein
MPGRRRRSPPRRRGPDETSVGAALESDSIFNATPPRRTPGFQPCMSRLLQACTQGFPEDESSIAGQFAAHAFRAWLPYAQGGNAFCLVASLVVFTLEPPAVKLTALPIMFGNALAFVATSTYLPEVEQRLGVLHAHRTFVRLSVANVLFIFLFAIPAAINGQSALSNVASPITIAFTACMLAFLIYLCQVLAFPPACRALVHGAILHFFFTSPGYTPLGTYQEAIVCMFAVVSGECIGALTRSVMWQHFAEAQGEHEVIVGRMIELDADRRTISRRNAQIDGEKERLLYELRIQERRREALSAKISRSRSRRSARLGGNSVGSSFGSDSEIGRILPQAAAGTDDRGNVLGDDGAELETPAERERAIGSSAGSVRELSAPLQGA